jgi:competence protein ComFC
MNQINKFLFKLQKFFYPINCFICGKHDNISDMIGICKKCIPKNQKNHKDLCPICCSNKYNINQCTYCNSRNVFFDKLYFIRYRTKIETEIIDSIKFQLNPQLRYFFRLNLNKLIPKLKKEKINLITYVPSNNKTLRKRPYLVIQPILDKTSRVLKSNFNLVTKKVSNQLQSEKRFSDRFFHARFAFSILNQFKDKLSGNILLIDDLFTTGATINETARILKENGAEKVFVLTLLKGDDG